MIKRNPNKIREIGMKQVKPLIKHFICLLQKALIFGFTCVTNFSSKKIYCCNGWLTVSVIMIKNITAINDCNTAKQFFYLKMKQDKKEYWVKLFKWIPLKVGLL